MRDQPVDASHTEFAVKMSPCYGRLETISLGALPVWFDETVCTSLPSVPVLWQLQVTVAIRCNAEPCSLEQRTHGDSSLGGRLKGA